MNRLAALLLLCAAGARAETGSAACAPCHREIFEKYRATGMARSSGLTGDGVERFTSATFGHAGASYRVTPQFLVEFRRGALRGERRMEYFIGSGAVGRSYAGFVDGFLFQSPASYFALRGEWGLSPGFQAKRFVEVARPIENACLQCHASRPQAVKGTENRYGEPPFLEGGVSCERCHGPGEAHVAGKGPMVNPAKLGGARRESVCLQCHLTGAARVAQPGRGPETFRAGDVLSDHVMAFVWSRAGGERTATDHAEQLARSQCQQKAGEKLWCGTCHDVHAGTTRAGACLDCHQPHPQGGADCAGCHMPKGRSREGEHVVFTDHTIARRPGEGGEGPRVMEPFRWMQPTERDWALAEPEKRVAVLERLAARPEADAAVLVQLAQIYDARGMGARAVPLYERALRLAPEHATAQANLGIYRMQAGRGGEALALWARAFASNPSMIGPGLNLAVGQAQAGDREGAVETLRRVLRFHPDNERAREMLRSLR